MAASDMESPRYASAKRIIGRLTQRLGRSNLKATDVNTSSVVYISHDACRAGAQIALLRLLRWIRRRGGPRPLVLLKRGGELREEFERTAETLDLGADSALQGRQEGFASARRWIAQKGARVVVSNTITNGDLLDALKLDGVPVVTWVHEMEYWIRHRLSPMELEAVRRRTNHYIAVSDAVQGCLEAAVGIEPGRITTIREFVERVPSAEDKAEWRLRSRRAMGIEEEAFVVTGCGTTDWRKGIDLFLALARLLERELRDVDWHAIWIGGAAEGAEAAPLRYDIERAGLGGRVHLLGARDEALEWIAAGDVLALTSREDPYPIVVLEAASFGIPVVCFANAGGAPEFVRDDAGVVVPYLDLSAFARSLAALEREPERRRRLGAAGRRRVEQEHRLDIVGPQILALLERISAEAVR